MQQKKYTVIANWKMYFSFTQAVTWLEQNKTALEEMCRKKNSLACIICPSFEVLATAKKLLSQSSIFLGAQDCSSHKLGAFTGQISVQSLKELGCTYCIVGHNESTITWKTDTQALLEKIKFLLSYNLIPIICFGENNHEYEQGLAEKSVTEQIQLLCASFEGYQLKKSLLLAYEPSWAIGSGKIPSQEHLKTIINTVTSITNNYTIPSVILYGGSVTAETLVSLKSITLLRGFLLGKTSTDFQELKKVVSLLQD